MTKREIIFKEAISLLTLHPEGLRYSELVKAIANAHTDIPKNTVHGTVWNLETRLPDQVIKPAKGLFQLKGHTVVPADTPITVLTAGKVKEEDFYQPFADWIVNELEECSKAISLGGAIFKDKWGTPDVIGILKPKNSDIIKFPTEIIVAEIKTDTNGLITAFGQTCSYRLFSHKSYIVIPNNSSKDDIARLDSLSLVFGIGLILFDPSNPSQPEFEIRRRALKGEPDMFYVNKYLKLIEDDLFN